MDYITRSSRDKIISYIMHYQLSKGAINSYYTRKKREMDWTYLMKSQDQHHLPIPSMDTTRIAISHE